MRVLLVLLVAGIVGVNASGMVAFPSSPMLATSCQMAPGQATIGFQTSVSIASSTFTLVNDAYAYSSGQCQGTAAFMKFTTTATVNTVTQDSSLYNSYNASYATTSDSYAYQMATQTQTAVIYSDAAIATFKSVCAEYSGTSITANVSFSAANGCAALLMPSVANCPILHVGAQSYQSGAALILTPLANVTNTGGASAYPCQYLPAFLVRTVVYGDAAAVPEGSTAAPTSPSPTTTATPTASTTTTPAGTATQTPTAVVTPSPTADAVIGRAGAILVALAAACAIALLAH